MKKPLITTMILTICSLTIFNAQAQLFERMDTNNNLVSQQSEDDKNISSGLIDYMRNSKDIEADFKQVTYNQRGEETSEGHMWLAKPGKFFWDYQSPYEQQIISDGQNVYHYDKDLEQITVRGKEELVGDVAIRLLEGQESLNNEFNIVQVTNEDLPSFIHPFSASTVVYSLTPKVDNTEYDAVWVVFDQDELAQVLVDGGTGQQTIMTFSNLKRNQGIDPTKFNFTPPDGVDVVGQINQ